MTRNVEYYVLAHASAFVPPGAVRIESGSGQGIIHQVAFQNPDGSFAAIVLNASASAKTIFVRQGGRAFPAELPAGALATFLWR